MAYTSPLWLLRQFWCGHRASLFLMRVAKCELDSPNAGGRLLPRRCTLDVGPSMIPDLRNDVWSSIEILMELKFLPYVLIA